MNPNHPEKSDPFMNERYIRTNLPVEQKTDRELSRAEFVEILQAALFAKEHRFARLAALKWLSAYPGDLQVSQLYAQVLVGEGRHTEALPIFRGLSHADPENQAVLRLYLETQKSISQSSQSQPHSLSTEATEIQNWLIALAGAGILSTSQKMGSKPDLPSESDAPDEENTTETHSSWGIRLYAIRKYLQDADLEQAEATLPALLASNYNTPLLALTHLEILQANPDTPLAARRGLGEYYHNRWPDCLPISLLLSSWLLQEGDTERAVSLLHQVASRDVSGSVATQLWGRDHPYKALWPNNLALRLDLVVPAAVAGRLGWNQLLPGEPLNPDYAESDQADALLDTKPDPDPEVEVQEKTVDKDILRMKIELDALATALDHLPVSETDGRFPVYVIFSVHANLVKVYGASAALELLQEMRNLASIINSNNAKRKSTRDRWGAAVFLPDLAESASAVGTELVTALDPWSLKLALSDLDASLARRGEMIGAILIVGGPEIVPFHNLPNPVDDPDPEVPSDNPYASRDENYFIPEWPVGRLPGGSGNDPWLLISGLRQIRYAHNGNGNIPSSRFSLFNRLFTWLRPNQPRRGFGYTAAVWRNASSHVFKPLGEPGSILVSPPVGLDGNGTAAASSNGKAGLPLPNAHLGYFNLHGLADSPEWYGQRDPLLPVDQRGQPLPDFPIALRPEDVHALGAKTPKIIFSEACYGALINNKTIDQALSLQFLSSGAQVLAGSTSMSYGAVNAPLIAADLLGYAFWQSLIQGFSAGEAFLRAKIHLATEMHRRQGYLDGEDQKTLISFVLYGDPLARLPSRPRHAKRVFRTTKKLPPVRTVCDRLTGECVIEYDIQQDQQNEDLPPELLGYVKKIVTQYLPGMEDARMTVSVERAVCTAHDHPEGHTCPTAEMNGKSKPRKQPDRQLVVLSKVFKSSIEKSAPLHQQYARLTLDGKGKLVKLVVSR